MKNKLQKGDYGYLNKAKLRELIISFVLILMVLIIFYTSLEYLLFLNHKYYKNTKNIFTVFAAVSVIPTARFLVSYIVMAPHKVIDRKSYEYLNQCKDITLLYDLLVSSKEKIMHLEVVAVKDNSIYVYTKNHKKTKAEIEKFIRLMFEKQCRLSAVKSFDNLESYRNAVNSLSGNESGRYDDRIKELLLIYSM